MNRIHALVVAHVVAGIALSWAACVYPIPSIGVSLGALFFGQCAVLAVWGGFSKTPQTARYAGVGAGTVYLWFVVTVPTGFRNSMDLIAFAVLIALCVVPALALFRALQLWGPTLIVCRANEITPVHEPFQFSIKHLLLLALAVAAALAVGRMVRSIDPPHQSDWLYMFLICIVLGACSLYSILAAVWACLAADKILLRKFLAFTAALLVGLIPPFYFDGPPGTDDFFFFVATAAGTQAVAMLSLDVVRSAGYRVVRTSVAAQTPQNELAAVHPLD